MAQRIDDHLRRQLQSEAVQQPGEFGIRDESQIEKRQQRAPALEKACNRQRLRRQERRARTCEHQELACRWQPGAGCKRQLADFVALRLERAAQAANSVARGRHDRRRGVVVAVVGDALEVGVELEIVDRQLVVPVQKAHRLQVGAKQALDADRDLALIGCFDLHAASVRLEHGGIRRSQSRSSCRGGFSIRIDDTQPKSRIAARHLLEHRTHALAARILRPQKIGERNRLFEFLDDLHRLIRRRIGLFSGQVDVHVVQHDGHIGQHCNADAGREHGKLVEHVRGPGPARLQREPPSDCEQHGNGNQPADKPQQGVGVERAVSHGPDLPNDARANARQRTMRAPSP